MAKALQRRVTTAERPCDMLLRLHGGQAALQPAHLQVVYGTFIKVFPLATVT